MSIYSKPDVLKELLGAGEVRVFVDLCVGDVVVPDAQREEAAARSELLCVDIGYAMARPIPDLNVDDQGVSATLSFNRGLAAVFLPWNAVVAVHQAPALRIVWGATSSGISTPKTEAPKRPALSLVKDPAQ